MPLANLPFYGSYEPDNLILGGNGKNDGWDSARGTKSDVVTVRQHIHSGHGRRWATVSIGFEVSTLVLRFPWGWGDFGNIGGTSGAGSLGARSTDGGGGALGPSIGSIIIAYCHSTQRNPMRRRDRWNVIQATCLVARVIVSKERSVVVKILFGGTDLGFPNFDAKGKMSHVKEIFV